MASTCNLCDFRTPFQQGPLKDESFLAGSLQFPRFFSSTTMPFRQGFSRFLAHILESMAVLLSLNQCAIGATRAPMQGPLERASPNLADPPKCHWKLPDLQCRGHWSGLARIWLRTSKGDDGLGLHALLPTRWFRPFGTCPQWLCHGRKTGPKYWTPLSIYFAAVLVPCFLFRSVVRSGPTQLMTGTVPRIFSSS